MAMALPNEGAARSPVKTYEDLRATIADSGRVYGEEKIQRAYALAEKAHKGQRRLSGESYISHPLAVAWRTAAFSTWTPSAMTRYALTLRRTARRRISLPTLQIR